jgi:hypothetical protein
MNTTSLKSFAPKVRLLLQEAITRKLDYVLSADTADLRARAAQVQSLRKQAERDRTGLLERVAYTWFNRFAALRFLDAKGWHPFAARVLTPATPEETQPELLKLTRNGSLPAELASCTDPVRLNQLLDGLLPSADPQGEVYRHLVLAACHAYHKLLPHLFAKIDDETELLLPDDLLTEHSVVQGFRTEISDEDCATVEVLGWLYQFYISDKKDAVMARKSAVPTEDIPAVTQLFTPHWIVRYLVENSLGRLWLLNRPGSGLRQHMPYYIEGEAETDSLRIEKPEDIRVIDPAVGSGHMLTYAFDLLALIYEEEGYAPSEIPALILRHNLHGVDICPRAAQLAELALVFKAREKSRRFLQPGNLVRPRILAMQDVVFEEAELTDYITALDLGDLFNKPVLELLKQFEQATTLGALIQPCLDEKGITALRAAIEVKDLSGQLFLSKTHEKVLRVLKQAEALAQRYHVAVANPPYMGSGGMNTHLKNFVNYTYTAGKADLYSAFMLQNLRLCSRGGAIGMITIPNWMFIESFRNLRGFVLSECQLTSLIYNGRGVWGGDFGSCAFIIVNQPNEEQAGHFRKLFVKPGEIQSNEEIEKNFKDVGKFPVFNASSRDFASISGSPIAFWISNQIRDLFRGPLMRSRYASKEGVGTRNDNVFMRLIWEVNERDIGIGSRWVLTDKAGDFRRWYGGILFVMDWENDGFRIKNYKNADGSLRSRPQNIAYLFREGVTWGKVGVGIPSFRWRPQGMAFNDAAPTSFGPHLPHLLAALNSSLVRYLLTIKGGTLNITTGVIDDLPLLSDGPELPTGRIGELSGVSIAIARADWDNFETSWDFRDLPLLRPELKAATLEASWSHWEAHCTAAIRRMQELETENNRLFIEAYGLTGELTPEVPEDQITLARADRRKDVVAFLSYAVGCMMGRYSLDHPGLILANAGDSLREFLDKVGKPMDALTFTPDEDGIIPVLDGEWFEDDIVSRTRDFLRATFGEATLAENLRFIEEALGKDLRKYFLTDFYKDHLSNERAYGYKKRPIYWLFTSGKKGFSALVYLHRYTKDTVNRLLNGYLREYLHKLRARIEHLEHVSATSTNTREKTAARKEGDALKKTLRECEDYERDTLLPLAQSRLELDLDDGVKVNYLKLGEALAPIAGLAAKEED